MFNLFHLFQRRTPTRDTIIVPTAPNTPRTPTQSTRPPIVPTRPPISDEMTVRMANHPIYVLPEVVPSPCPTMDLGSEEVWQIVLEATKYNFHSYPSHVHFNPILLNNSSMNQVVSYTIVNMVNHFEHATGLSCCHFACQNLTGQRCQLIGVADRPNYIKFKIRMHMVASCRDKYSGILMLATIVHGGQPGEVASYTMKHYIEFEPNSGYHFQPYHQLVKTTRYGNQEMVPAKRIALVDMVPQ
jgi:hypothetical protein